jgi:hypothetical protein
VRSSASGLHEPLTNPTQDEADAAPATGTVNPTASALAPSVSVTVGGGGGGGAAKSGSGGAARKKERLRSLDTFRGLCLSIMIFVV